jgi:predicted GNAT family N-acyltransferase
VLKIELMPWERARADASRIRTLVFVEEQQVPSELEMDEHDVHCIHALAFIGEDAIGTARLLPDGHIGRMAVLKPWRGKGVGSAILARLIEAARNRGEREVMLSAQTHALAFYRAHGFVEEGDEYLEAGIPHRAMRRRLGSEP